MKRIIHTVWVVLPINTDGKIIYDKIRVFGTELEAERHWCGENVTRNIVEREYEEFS